MTDDSPWQDGHAAWGRLFRQRPEAADGDQALDGLRDLARVRQILDEAELAFVRSARAAKKSWAEIATRLGVSRQSAWEKWRDLDDDAEQRADPLDTAPGAEDIDALIPRLRRVRRWAVVPDVVGLSWTDARDVLLDTHLAPVNAAPDTAPDVLQSGVVIRQYPDPETKVRTGQQVRLWVERGGEAGVREPRRPHPTLREDAAQLDIEGVG